MTSLVERLSEAQGKRLNIRYNLSEAQGKRLDTRRTLSEAQGTRPSGLMHHIFPLEIGTDHQFGVSGAPLQGAARKSIGDFHERSALLGFP